MQDSSNRRLDIHVFEYDEEGKNSYGIAYPFGSLDGHGSINGQQVQCISPEWMFRFKTAFEPAAKDRQDVASLAAQYAWEIPRNHVTHDG